MSATDIFLSYARQDRPKARVIAQCLIDEGLKVWWDASLHSGETFDEVIERNLREAKAVVVLWSPISVASRWVRAEATLADRKNKLVPAVIDRCDRPIIFELTHTADLTDWTGDKADARWRTFVEDLYRLVDEFDARSSRSERVHEAEDEAMKPEPVAVPLGSRATGEARERSSHEINTSTSLHGECAVQSAIHAAAAHGANEEFHCLEVEEGELASDIIVVGSAGVKIGRRTPADIVIPHRSISREHCIVGVANDELLVTDLNSTNGTFIDDVRIKRATILPVGSVLRVGEVSMRHAVHVHGGSTEDRSTHASLGLTTAHVGRFATAG